MSTPQRDETAEVGQRVWLPKLFEHATITEITGDGAAVLRFDDGEIVKFRRVEFMTSAEASKRS